MINFVSGAKYVWPQNYNYLGGGSFPPSLDEALFPQLRAVHNPRHCHWNKALAVSLVKQKCKHPSLSFWHNKRSNQTVTIGRPCLSIFLNKEI